MKKLINLCLIGIISLLMLFPAKAFAVDNPSEPYLFIKDMIQVTGFIYSSGDRFKTNEQQLQEENELLSTLKIMKDLRTASNDIETAKIYISKHKDSKNEIISKSSVAMLSALDLLSKNYQDTIKYFEVLYSPEIEKNPNAGKMMSDLSKIMSDRDEILRMCIYACIMSTYSLLSDKVDKEGHLSYLTITNQERDDLRKTLEDYFGENIKNGLKAGQSLLISPAAALYEFLKKNNFTPAEKYKR